MTGKNKKIKTKKADGFLETDLYAPIKQLLTAQGFLVKGEVKGCDIAAVKADTLWIVEMKRHFNLKLLYQAMERQKITADVFVAVPKPKRMGGSSFVKMRQLLTKMELGLIVVTMDSLVRTAEIVLYPGGKPKKANASAAAVRQEIAGRTGDTAGGITRAKINTAYRESCLQVACALERAGILSAAALIRHYHCAKGAYNIMYKNFYGWFTHAKRGVFTLSDEGRRYLNENADSSQVAHYRFMAAEAWALWQESAEKKEV